MAELLVPPLSVLMGLIIIDGEVEVLSAAFVFVFVYRLLFVSFEE